MPLAVWARAGHASLFLLPSKRQSHWGSPCITLSSVLYQVMDFAQYPAWRMNMWRNVLSHCKQTWLWPASHTNHPAYGSWIDRGIVQLPGWLFQSAHLSGGDKPWNPLLISLEVDLGSMWSLIQIVFLSHLSFFWKAVELPYMVPEQLGYSWGHDIRHGRYDISSLWQMIYYHHDGVIDSAQL